MSEFETVFIFGMIKSFNSCSFSASGMIKMNAYKNSSRFCVCDSCSSLKRNEFVSGSSKFGGDSLGLEVGVNSPNDI